MGGGDVTMRRAEQENGAGVVLSKVEEEETGLELSIETEGWNSSSQGQKVEAREQNNRHELSTKIEQQVSVVNK